MGLPSRQAFYDLPQEVQDEWVGDWLLEHDKRVEYEPEVLWHPQRIANQRDMAIAWATWKYNETRGESRYHDGTFTSWSTKRSDAHPFDMWDGVTITAAQEDLGDRWYEATSRPVPTSDDDL